MGAGLTNWAGASLIDFSATRPSYPAYSHHNNPQPHTERRHRLISWTLTTATEDGTGAALNLRPAAAELIDATRASIIESDAAHRPVYTLTLDGDWLTSIATGDTPTGAPDRGQVSRNTPR